MSMTNNKGRLKPNNNNSNLCGRKTCSPDLYVAEAAITPTLASMVAQLTIRVPAPQSHNFSTIRLTHAQRALSSLTNSTKASKWPEIIYQLSRLMIFQTTKTISDIRENRDQKNQM